MLDLFGEKPRANRVRRMHMIDVGDCHTGRAEDLGKPLARFQCKRCDTETDWLVCENATEVERGIPCENCNEVTAPE